MNIDLLIADSILHTIWLHRLSTASLTSFDRLVKKIKFTPRDVNRNAGMLQCVKYLSWYLNVNINIIGLKKTRNSRIECGHTQSYKCVFPFYIFQNTLVKIMGTNRVFPNIYILFHRNRYFYINRIEGINPVLLKSFSNSPIWFQNRLITNENVMQILKNEPCSLPFNVKIYTSYSFVRGNCLKESNSTTIGDFFVGEEKGTIFLFLAPAFDTTFNIYRLMDLDRNLQKTTINFLTNIYTPEGTPVFKCKSKKNEILNQEYCICEHPETQRIYLPQNSDLKPLGNKTCYIWFELLDF